MLRYSRQWQWRAFLFDSLDLPVAVITPFLENNNKQDDTGRLHSDGMDTLQDK
jgi:hypothetical protein